MSFGHTCCFIPAVLNSIVGCRSMVLHRAWDHACAINCAPLPPPSCRHCMQAVAHTRPAHLPFPLQDFELHSLTARVRAHAPCRQAGAHGGPAHRHPQLRDQGRRPLPAPPGVQCCLDTQIASRSDPMHVSRLFAVLFFAIKGADPSLPRQARCFFFVLLPTCYTGK